MTSITWNESCSPMLAGEYNPDKHDVVGKLMSEKLDGYRAVWDGNSCTFYSRNGKKYNAPEWFVKCFPQRIIDGELWISRVGFQKMGAVRKKIPLDEEWAHITFQAYDLIDCEGDFEERLTHLRKLIKLVDANWKRERKNFDYPMNKLKCPLRYVEQVKIESVDHMRQFYENIVENGGEGIMIKCPRSIYQQKRSKDLWKYKPNYDAEAIITGFRKGKGKYKRDLGAFECLPNTSTSLIKFTFLSLIHLTMSSD